MFRYPAIFAAAALALAACGAPSSTDAAPSSSAPAAVTQSVEQAIATGTFVGESDHVTTGAVRLIGTEGNYQLVFAADFSLDGAPDPVVGFGINGKYNAASKLGDLQKKTGAQTYALPADFDPAANTEVYVWCDKFSVPLGVAVLSN